MQHPTLSLSLKGVALQLAEDFKLLQRGTGTIEFLLEHWTSWLPRSLLAV
jgi:hypothetical protein